MYATERLKHQQSRILHKVLVATSEEEVIWNDLRRIQQMKELKRLYRIEVGAKC